MYSRPSAFGPTLSGLTQGDQSKVSYNQLSSSAYEILAEHASALSVGVDTVDTQSVPEIAKNSLVKQHVVANYMFINVLGAEGGDHTYAKCDASKSLL